MVNLPTRNVTPLFPKNASFDIGEHVEFRRSDIYFSGTIIKIYVNSALIALDKNVEYEFNNTVAKFSRLEKT